MTRFLLRLHDFLASRRRLAAALLLLLVALGIGAALRMRYQENVADFLPRDAVGAKQSAVYNALGDQGRVTVLFRPVADATADDVSDAIDRFGAALAAVAPAHGIAADSLALQAAVDESDARGAVDEVRDHIALYLTDDDYRRIDSLLADPAHMGRSLAGVRQTLALPLPEMVQQMVTTDPLGLFGPALSRLQALSPSSRYEVRDGYLFDSAGVGYAFLTSPFGSSDTRQGARLAALVEQAADSAASDAVAVSAVGAPLIAVANAQRIKKDSILSISLSVLLIAVVLWRAMRSRRNILWMGLSVAAGWLFALAAIALFKGEVSIIVVGIGSVLVGIAVNYPLHYLEHQRHHPDRREGLREMVEPLVTGNVTTVAAFACLLFVKAEAMRDLGLFGSLMLVGTMAFVMVFLPLWAKGGRAGEEASEAAGEACEAAPPRSPRGRRWQRAGFWALVAATALFAVFSQRVQFDSDLHNINYMTARQQADLEWLSAGVGESDLTYVVAEGATLEEALQRNERLGLGGVAALAPSLQRQQESLERWRQLVARHPDLPERLRGEAAAFGFAPSAFDPFAALWHRTYAPRPVDANPAVMQMARNYILQTDTACFVLNYHHGALPAAATDAAGGCFAFSQRDVGSSLVTALSDDFNYILYMCSFVVFAFLWIALGRLELALLAFLPMAMGWVWILGIMALTGIKFNIINIILATFIFGQGDDYTIFITEGLLYENATGKRRLAEYRRSVLLSAVLMFVGMGTLVLAQHPAMRSLGEVAVVGMGCVVLMSCVVPPVIFRWLTTRRGERRGRPITLKRVLITWVPLLVFALFAMLVATPLTLLFMLFPARRDGKRAAYHRFICGTARLGARLLPLVRVRVENPGGERFDEPAVIVANHASHLDLLCMLMLHPKLVILTKDWVWRNPLYALIIRYAEFLPATDGYQNTLPKLKALVERGYSIMIFPEGTRTRTGRVGRFHKGAFALAEALQLPLLPVYIHGAYDVWPKSEPLITEGQVTVGIGTRCHGDNKQMRQQFVARLEEMGRRLETPQYRYRMERYDYMYKGREVWQQRPKPDKRWKQSVS